MILLPLPDENGRLILLNWASIVNPSKHSKEVKLILQESIQNVSFDCTVGKENLMAFTIQIIIAHLITFL